MKKVTIAFSFAIFLFISVALCLPAVQNFLILIGEKILGRPFNAPDVWRGRIINCALHIFFIAFIDIWLYIRDTQWYSIIRNSHFMQHNKKYDLIISACCIVFFFILFMLPFVIYGKNSVITIHDNLEDSVPRFHYIYKNNLFWRFEEKLPIMNGTSSLFFNREGFTLYNAIYCLLPTYIGYVINHVLCVILGFLSMLFFQKIVFKDENIVIITLTSIAYALLPAICVYKMGVAMMPFAGILFYKLLTSNEKKWFLLAFLYPFTTELAGIGLFVMLFWVLAAIAVFIKQHKINLNILLGLILVGIGFCITDSRLIYARIALQVPLNRDFTTVAPASFIGSFVQFFLFGLYHAATLQFMIVDCAVLVVAYMLMKQKHTYGAVIKACLIVCFGCALIASLSEAKIIDKIISMILPFLKGISMTRIYTVSRMAWYVAFTASLLYIAKKRKVADLACALALLQIIRIFLSPTQYNDSEASWRHNLIGSSDVTWREFYAEEQFKQIKSKINYNGENVCAVGYHPGVLLYNDFNTIDGYLSVYPYEQQLRWHDLMTPEFEQNQKDMDYFDSWGGRRYIYNKEISYQPTREGKYHDGANLHVDMDMLKNYYNCKYILSRTELLNAEALGLRHLGTFDDENSIYVIWVYEVEV